MWKPEPAFRLAARGDVVESVMGSKQQSSRLVFVGDDGDVYEASGGRKPKRLTWGWTYGPTQERLQYVWPSYSPNGEHVACFGVQAGNGDTAGLYAVTDDGVSRIGSKTAASG